MVRKIAHKLAKKRSKSFKLVSSKFREVPDPSSGGEFPQYHANSQKKDLNRDNHPEIRAGARFSPGNKSENGEEQARISLEFFRILEIP
jgi:hypothetical protein